MNVSDINFILSYFEGKIDIYECINHCKICIGEHGSLLDHVNYLERDIESSQMDSDYLLIIEDYLLDIISAHIQCNCNILNDFDIRELDINEIKSFLKDLN